MMSFRSTGLTWKIGSSVEFVGRKPAMRGRKAWRGHPVPDSEKMELQDYRRLGERERDAGQDYPESDSEAPVVRFTDRCGWYRARAWLWKWRCDLERTPGRSALVAGKRPPGYDTLATRRFEFVPLWGIAVFLVYAMRRVACASCAVKVETVPWASGKHQLTDTYAWFLARWARRLSWKEVAGVFHTSWEKVFRSVQMAVRWGRGSPAAQWNHRDRHRRDRLAARASISNACISDSTKAVGGYCGSVRSDA